MGIFLIEDVTKLENIGLKDSKLLSPIQRSILYKKLKVLGKYEVIKLTPAQIDTSTAFG